MKIKRFTEEFQSMYLHKLNECHLGILLSRTTNFVGTRTLALSIKFISLNMKYKETRELIRPKIESILFNLSLPLFVTSQKDMITFQSDPIEYVRLQVDNQNEYNVKRQLSELVEKICGLKYGKRREKRPPVYLQQYLQTIA